MKLTANTLIIILLVSADILQPKLTGSLRLVRELRRGEHDGNEYSCPGGAGAWRLHSFAVP